MERHAEGGSRKGIIADLSSMTDHLWAASFLPPSTVAPSTRNDSAGLRRC